jgi:hypothetical protein
VVEVALDAASRGSPAARMRAWDSLTAPSRHAERADEAVADANRLARARVCRGCESTAGPARCRSRGGLGAGRSGGGGELPQCLTAKCHNVLVELVDEEHRDRVADLLVLDQLRARVLPRLVVEDLPVHPRREDRPSAIKEAITINVQTSTGRRRRSSSVPWAATTASEEDAAGLVAAMWSSHGPPTRAAQHPAEGMSPGVARRSA